MRFSGIFIVLAALSAIVTRSFAQAPPPQLPFDSMELNGSRALLWSQDQSNIVELRGPLSIHFGHTRLSSDNAVIWITPRAGGQGIQIALMGNAELRQGSIVRTERNLLVSACVTGAIRLIADRSSLDDHQSALYSQATALREGNNAGVTQSVQSTPGLPERRWANLPPAYSAPAPTTAPAINRPKQIFEFNDRQIDRATTSDGHIAYVLSGGVACRYLDAKQNMLEFVARDVVLFTDLTTLVGLSKNGDQKHLIADHLLGGYFEGDVQVYVTPADQKKNELRMRAERIYYDFRTDRAVLTDVVFHTVDIQRQIPVFMRAQVMHQLSQGEYRMKNVELTTSAFATPTYSMAASDAYVRAEGTGDPESGDRITFSTQNATLDAFGVPLFYLPVAGGTMTSRGGPLRGFSVGDDGDYGYNVRSQWGLFESLGDPAPKDLDASYRLDYYGKRGPGAGFDAKYQGGFISDISKDPWNFLGDLHSYFVDDHGLDDLGGLRPPVDPRDDFRGRAYLEHQHFFPDDWQAQLRFGYVSDANFLTQWFPDEFRDNLPIDESIYLKHQQDSEVFSLFGEFQPNDVITTAQNVQEQREVEYLPEVAYHRIGDSFADDRLTFFSDNTAAGLQFAHSGSTLAQQGLAPTGILDPGLPSFAYTGDPGDTTYRGDFRQEIDWPVNAGPIKMVPFAFGRYTVYSQGVDQAFPPPIGKTLPTTPTVTSSDQNRVMAGAGVKFSTSFWKVDDTIESDLFDIHRIRHVIEPEIDLFTSAQTLDQNRVFIYNESVDGINDVQAVQLALRQRWQTKRGGPGKWRSVDVFSFNITANLFSNQPDRRFLDPVDFRGLYFSSLPEASIPRNSLNADAMWRISDTTAVLADCSENLDREKFATASIGLAVQRDQRLSYFIGNRYIADLNSNITTIQATYQVSRSYDLSFSESFDFGQSRNVYYSATITRKFDRFRAGIRVYYDETTNENGVSFEFAPYGFGRGIGTDQAQELAKQ